MNIVSMPCEICTLPSKGKPLCLDCWKKGQDGVATPCERCGQWKDDTKTLCVTCASTLIPNALRNDSFRFVLIRGQEKRAFEKGWQNESNYKYHDERLRTHLQNGGNYGVLGGPGGLAVIDVDNPDYIEKITASLPPTFVVKTHKGLHLYFTVSDGIGHSKVLKDMVTGETVGDLKAGLIEKPEGRGYVVGPGSIHPEGDGYEILEEQDIAEISPATLRDALEAAGVIIGSRPSPRKANGIHHRRPPRETPQDEHLGGDPLYFTFLPLWCRTHHRARNGGLLRGSEGRHVHLRICATLKKHGGDEWKDYAHDLTAWMFNNDYDPAKTDSELKGINEHYAFGPADFFFYKNIAPDMAYLTDDERNGITVLFMDNIERF